MYIEVSSKADSILIAILFARINLLKTVNFGPKNYRLKRNGNSANFSRIFVMTKIFFAAKVRCVSSMIVILNAKLPRLVAASASKKYGEK